MELSSLLTDLGLIVITAAMVDADRLRAVTWVCLTDTDGEPRRRVLMHRHRHRTNDAALLVERHGLIAAGVREGRYDGALAAVGVHIVRVGPKEKCGKSVDEGERRTA